MLDTIISPNNYAYQFRVDVLPPSNAFKYVNAIQLMLHEEEFRDWICCFEIGEVTKKQHFQCILWSKVILSTKERNRMKAKYFRTNRDANNSISFTDAKKIINLSSYVLKDNDDLNDPGGYSFSSLSVEQREKIPDWLTKENIKSKFLKELEDECLLICSKNVYGHYPSLLTAATSITRFYVERDRSPPNRHVLTKLLLKYHPSYSYTDYVLQLNIFGLSN